MTYNYNNVLKCIESVKALNTTAAKKADHKFLWYEVKKAFDICYDLTSCTLFDYEWSIEATTYFKSVNDNFKNVTKKELDKMLKSTVNYLKWELHCLHNEIIKGELQSDYNDYIN